VSRHQTQKLSAKSGPQKIPADQSLNLASDLRTYAVWAVEQVAKEYGYQIGKWERHINLVADAHAEAHGRYEKLFEEMAAADGLAMMALSFVAGPMLSWVSGAIQYTKFPAMAKKLAERKGVKLTGQEDFVRVRAKIFGDTAVSTIRLGAGKTFSMTMPPDSSKLLPSLAAEGRVGTLKTILQNELSHQSDRVLKSMNKFGQSIQQDLLYGQSVLENMYRTVPGSDSFPYLAQESAAKGLIRHDVDEQRHRWAAQWAYYGCDPNPEAYHIMVRKIEKEIWALWVLDQKFKFHETPSLFGAKTGDIYGEDGMLREEIVNRLVELDVVLAQLKHYYGTGIITEESQQRMDKQIDRRKADVSMSIPVLREGDIDTKAELRALTDWAAFHEPELLGGKLDRITRRLPSLNEIHDN